MKVVVTGAAGHLGAAIVREFGRQHEVTALTRADLDITDAAAVARAVSAVGPGVLINCAADNDVDGAEDEPVRAFQVNAFGVQALARAAADAGAVLVHFSTDFVFDGRSERPYTEDDRPGPLSVYGASKLVGEWLAREAPRHYVLRVESLFGPEAPGAAPRSVGKIVSGVLRGEEVPVFVDRVVSPTSVADAARAVAALTELTPPYGTYHCVNSGSCGWDELTNETARLLGRDVTLKPLTLDSIPLSARRPRYCALSNAKLTSIGISMPRWQEALKEYVRTRVSA